ncbi:MAG: peptide ABC transporter substrate-binding protein [Clostridia bacterium]|nr:peptide ABC transporter substrate-binding protein [Clostridia bacterium]
MKRTLALFLVFVMLFGVLAGCNKKTEDDGAQEPAEKQLAVQVGPDPETIDPALNSAVDGGNMLLHLYECLLTVDQAGELAPGAAETWETSEDGLTWTFHLRDGLKWSDGSDLTAEDFVYSWKRVVDPATAAPYAETVLQNVKGFEAAAAGDVDALAISAPDAKTFVVELSAPCTYFGSLAAFATLSPVQKATIEANGDGWAVSPETYVCNGPFYITEWVPGSHILTAKNPNYWNADAIKLDSIKWLLIEDSNAAYSAYQTGEALFIKDVPTEEIPSLRGNGEFHVEPIIGTYYISLNTEVSPFDNADVRKALSLAIDRQYVADTLMQGTYSPAWNFMGPGWIDPLGGEFMDKANGGEVYIGSDYEANLAEARELMQKAGYAGDPENPDLQITYSTNDAGYHKVVAEYLQDAWAQIGVQLKVDIVEWASFTPMRRAGDYEISRNGWVGDYSDPSNMLDLLYSTNGNNDGNFKNADFDANMDISRTTVDPTERSAALHAAEDILMEQAACIPVAYYNDFWLQSPSISGMWHSAYGYWYFMYADIA